MIIGAVVLLAAHSFLASLSFLILPLGGTYIFHMALLITLKSYFRDFSIATNLGESYLKMSTSLKLLPPVHNRLAVQNLKSQHLNTENNPDYIRVLFFKL